MHMKSPEKQHSRYWSEEGGVSSPEILMPLPGVLDLSLSFLPCVLFCLCFIITSLLASAYT